MKPNQQLETSKKTQVQNMFNAISIEYDLLPYWLRQKRKINTLIIEDRILDFGTPENYKKI